MRLLPITLVFLLLGVWPAFGQHLEPAGEGEIPVPTDEITPQERARIKAEIGANISRLRAERRLPDLPPHASAPAAGSLGWPLRLAPSGQGYGYHGTSNFVDLNASLGAVLDWNCGSRSYDTPSSGYNHGGTDLFLWPFSWRMMDLQDVRVVAAAAGTIVAKSDGNYDRSCATGSGTANSVYIRHLDGSVAWYLHMKNGSVTSKAVGSSVARGEYLGTVGSSGSSSGPHLHFEIHDAAGNVVDPFAGTCNPGSSLWAVQPAYYDSAINRIATHSAAPVFPTCPTQETPSYSDDFQPGDRVYFATYFRDRLSSQTATYTIYKPDGSVYSTWTHAPGSAHSSSYYAYWYFTLPSTVPTGIWRFKSNYNGTDYEHRFRVGTSVALVRPQTGWWWNAAEPGRGYSLEVRGNTLFLSSYLYAADGSSVWYISLGGLSGNSYQGRLLQYGGGQTLDGGFQEATLAGDVGAVSLDFTSETAATLTWPGGTVALQRFDIVTSGVAAGPVADAPETGWWWNASEPGRGYFAEIQGSTLFLSGYMYDSRGQATWFVTQNVLTEPLTYQGSLLEYAGGQTLTGAFQLPAGPVSRGAVTIQFTSATDGTMTLPNGASIALTRYRF